MDLSLEVHFGQLVRGKWKNFTDFNHKTLDFSVVFFFPYSSAVRVWSMKQSSPVKLFNYY